MKIRGFFSLLLVVITLVIPLGTVHAGAVIKVGDTCSKNGEYVFQGNISYQCAKSGNKLMWKVGSPSLSFPNPTTSTKTVTKIIYPKLTDKINLGFQFNKSGIHKIDIWEDFQCPNCAKFETTNKEFLNSLIKNPQYAVTYHTLGFIGLESELAANAAACASDEGKFSKMHELIFANQAPTRNAGIWTNDSLILLAKNVPLTTTKFKSCVNSFKYTGWLAAINNSTKNQNITAVPTVFVDGKAINRNTDYYDPIRFKEIVANSSLIVPNVETPTATASTTAAPVPTKLTFSVSKTLGIEPVVGKPLGLPPALLYAGDVVQGTGAVITAPTKITVNYVVMNWNDGKILQSTWPTGSRQVDMTTTIQGWQKGLIGMKEGGRRILICPPDWAYGSAGNSKVAPNATVVFVVDLLKITN